MIYDEEIEVNFCEHVAEIVVRDYQEEIADLCFTLMSKGQIPKDASLEEAARIVVQRMLWGQA
jgi:hypothetical protein